MPQLNDADADRGPDKVFPIDVVLSVNRIQTWYRGYKTRRALQGFALTAGRWRELAQFSLTWGSFKEGQHRREGGKASVVTSTRQWQRIQRRLLPLVRNGGLTLQKEHWLEVADRKHRYGSRLRVYHDYWLSLQECDQSFFHWLEHEGADVDLPECPRAEMEASRVRYCSSEEVLQYQVVVNERGLLQYNCSGQLLDTGDAAPGTIPGVEGYLPPGEHDDYDGLSGNQQQQEQEGRRLERQQQQKEQLGQQQQEVAVASSANMRSSPRPACAAAAPAAAAGACCIDSAKKGAGTATGAAVETQPVGRQRATSSEPGTPGAAHEHSGVARLRCIGTNNGSNFGSCAALAQEQEFERQCSNDGKPSKPKDAFIYVMDMNHRLFVAKKVRGTFHHSSFLRGCPVLAAGGIRVHRGALQRITAMSGHYKPSQEDIDALVGALSGMGIDMERVSISRQVKKKKGDKKLLLGSSSNHLSSVSVGQTD